MSPSGGFDRLPRRPPPVVDGRRPPADADEPIDQAGKRALFSAVPAAAEGSEPAFGAVTFHCSACGAATVQPAIQALRSLVPSLHLPILRRRYPSWARCPACGKRTWLRLSVRL
jgi:predicted RNA-binding Zn-ribbon protein involved in translation (DUF1610 family)